MASQGLWNLTILIFLYDMNANSEFFSYLCIVFVTAPAFLACNSREAGNAEAQGWRLRDGNLYIGKALLDALNLTLGNLAVPKQ